MPASVPPVSAGCCRLAAPRLDATPTDHLRAAAAPERTRALADLPGQQADRERAQARDERDAQALQLDRLHQPDRASTTSPKKYNCKVEWTTFNTITDAISKIKSGEADYDVFVPTPDNLGQLIESEADPAAQPQLHPEHRASCWPDYQEPLLRPGLAVHGAVHGLHDRDRLAEGPRRRQPLPLEERVPVPVAEQVRRQGRDPGRLPRGAVARSAVQRHPRPQHDVGLAAQLSKASLERSEPSRGRRPDRQQRLHATCRAARSGSTTPGRATWHRLLNTCRRACRSRSSATGSRPTGSDRLRTTRWSCWRPRRRLSSHTCSSTTCSTSQERCREHQLQRLHPAADRDHARAARQGEDPPAEPDVDRRRCPRTSARASSSSSFRRPPTCSGNRTGSSSPVASGAGSTP